MPMKYSEIIRLAPWQKKSAAIKDRDGWECRRCKDCISNLQVHHLYYMPNTLPWDYPDDALITLCDLCHMKAEFIKNLMRWIWILSDQGFTPVDMAQIKDHIIYQVERNKHRESVIRYMEDIKLLIHG